jgi:type IV pilus assembly protein PilB
MTHRHVGSRHPFVFAPWTAAGRDRLGDSADHHKHKHKHNHDHNAPVWAVWEPFRMGTVKNTQPAGPNTPALDRVKRSGFVATLDPALVSGHSVPNENTVQLILSHLNPDPGMKILVLGGGSGYLPAVLSRLVAKVVSVEIIPSLALLAKDRYQKLGYDNITVLVGDGNQGAMAEAPFDAIVVCSPSIWSKSFLFDQVRANGRLLCIETNSDGKDVLIEYQHNNLHKLERQELVSLPAAPSKEEILIELGLGTVDTIREAKKRALAKGTLIVDELRHITHVDETELYRSLSERYKLDIGNFEEMLRRAQPKLFERFPRAFLDNNRLIPLYVESNRMTVATTDTDASLKEICMMYPEFSGVEKILVTPTDFRRLWSTLSLCAKCNQNINLAADTVGLTEEELQDKSEPPFGAHLVSLFEALLLDAVSESASDIHVEQYGDNIRLRLRVDGDLHNLTYYALSPAEARGLVNVIKLRADLDIAERRRPQGGRSRLRVGESLFDLRVQIQPSLHGEHVVIRLLPQSSELIGIESLGLSPAIANHYRRLVDNPAGLVLVVGPTGSGKSTTLYAGLQVLAKDGRRKVITVEDPIEYSINDIQQTQVRPDIGFSFADAMRSFVRQDPDVILVGEIRDYETALEAIRASQTGHVVLSTLHSNDAVDALQRIFDLGIQPNSIASELLAIIAQRLAKRICQKCKHEIAPDPAILAELFPDGAPKNFRCFQGKGCDYCGNRGTKGRIGVIEYMQANNDIRDAISRKPPVGELRRLALDAGLVTMRDSALDHVILGNIPLSELPRILPAERMAPEARWQWGRG